MAVALAHLRDRIAVERIERVWLFSPVVRGRREQGLLVASVLPGEDDPAGRVVVTVRYTAQRTGSGPTVEPTLHEEGVVPRERLPRIIEGVMRRSELETGPPREFPVEGDPERFEALEAGLKAAREESPL